MMQLLGQSVNHTIFGGGRITDISGEIMTIHFAQGEKKFVYPEAFSAFLTLNDAQKQEELYEESRRLLQTEEAQRKIECLERESMRQIRAMSIAPNAQAAFHITSPDARSVLECGVVSTGSYLRGACKGQPRIPARLKPNSTCLLTGLPGSGAERDRRILGAFMVKESCWGEQCKNGTVEAHERYRICLPADYILSYWDYFDHGEAFPRWGNIAFKYFSNETMQRILFDLTGLLAGTAQGPAINRFYQYFCRINLLPVVPAREGDTL